MSASTTSGAVDRRLLAHTKLTPEQRKERARKAGQASQARLTPDQRQAGARKAAKARTSLDAYIKSLVDRAPELNPRQIAQLRAIVAPHIGSDGAA